MATDTKAGAVLNALERDLIRKPEAPAGLLLREIGAPDGLRRADAIWLPAGHAYGLTGFEVKVSRADLISELASPHKCESWKKYCRYWWLVVSEASLIEGLEIPAEWGVKTPPTQKNRRAFTVLKPGPELDPSELGPALVRLGSVWAYERHQRQWQIQTDRHALEVQRGTINSLEHKLREAGVKVADTFDAANQQRVHDFIEALQRRQRYGGLPHTDPDVLADAVIEHLETEKLRNQVALALDDKIAQLDRAFAKLAGNWRITDLLRDVRRTRDTVKAGGTP